MKILNITRARFNDAFHRVGWVQSIGKSGMYDIWTSPKESGVWTVVPHDENSEEYSYYEDKNLKILLYATDLEETEDNLADLQSQLHKYNYKFLNRIAIRDEYKQDSVPYDLAKNLIDKNISAFRSYYQLKRNGGSIPIENFEFNHTQRGSFVIPVSVSAEVKEDSLELNIPSDTNVVIHDYLDTIDQLTKIKTGSEKEFADYAMEFGIDSKIVKDFMGESNSIAEYRQRYEKTVKELSVSGKSNPILDYKLGKENKDFKKVTLEHVKVIPTTYIEYLEEREVEVDASSIVRDGANIDVSVDAVDQNNTAKFTVHTINGEPVKRPFKARTTRLSKYYLNLCAMAFIERSILGVEGDIEKPKGRIGTIIYTSFSKKPNQEWMFDEKNSV